ncbi:hypothetical protein Moror_1158 [Moniliophthora roreri MCA 2997]|uniref:DUF6533 domain-containing protein n=2 Tax=Moniliophthora roreri TaxID=221103 RepID=V2WW20_MONRO|nr:hypothetical protein Moror_1158 [Moniliophthora roreri MCA 2997]
MNVQLVASCLGLALNACDMYLTRKEEKALIWRSPFRVTIVKILYILSRYLGLTCQIYNVSRSAYWKHRYTTIPQHSCDSHLVFKTLGAQSLLAILHIILMLRVYALYNKTFSMVLILMLIYAARLAATIWTTLKHWDVYKMDFDYICFTTEPLNSGYGMIIFITAEALFEIIIHTLIARKTWSLPGTWSKTPTLMSVLTRDGFYVFFAIFVGMVSALGGSRGRGPATLFVNPLLVFVISCAGSRVIIRLQRFGSEEESDSASSQGSDMFSTIAWDIRTFPNLESGQPDDQK